MRLPCTMALIVAAAAAGCASMRPKDSRPRPPVAAGDVALQQTLAYWNNNAQRIESLYCDHVDIDGKSEGQIYTLNAKLAYQRPSRLRMIGTSFGGKTEADLGSNEDEVWFWIARAKPPALYYCKRTDLPNVRLATPFQPDWLIEAVGVTPVNPQQYRQVQFADAEYVGVVAKDQSPTGQNVTKRIVFRRATGRIAAFELFDASDKLMAVAHIDDYFDDAATGLFVPRDVELLWPDADTKLRVRLVSRRTKLNSVTEQQSASLFRRYPGDFKNVDEIDLARLDANRRAQASAAPAHPPQTGSGSAATIRPAELTGQIQSAPLAQ